MNKIIIIGASGFGREVAWLIERINKVNKTWNIVGFIDDNEKIIGSEINGYKVLGKVDNIIDYPDAYYVCAIASASIRKNIISRAKKLLPNISFATLIDPTVEISNTVSIGEGSIICAHTIITVNIIIGNHTVVNWDCTIGHDAILEDFVTLYPSVNVSGATKIGSVTEIGTGANIIQLLSVGKNTIIGAGSVVIRNIPDNCTAVGCPARPLDNNKSNDVLK